MKRIEHGLYFESHSFLNDREDTKNCAFVQIFNVMVCWGFASLQMLYLIAIHTHHTIHMKALSVFRVDAYSCSCLEYHHPS